MDGGFSLQTPLPPPRAKSPTPPVDIVNSRGVPIKKPVPLPRRTIMEAKGAALTPSHQVLSSSSSGGSGSGSSCSLEDKKTSEGRARTNGYKDDPVTRGYSTLTKSLRNEFRSASDSVHEKGKAVIESTKNVSARLEKSVRGILAKRQSVAVIGTSPPENEPCKIHERCSSLPGEEIFSSISFDSPLSINGSVKNDSFDSDDFELEENVPPPAFPPPPLPDESLYDEVQSVRSSHSGSHSYENYALPPSTTSTSHDSSSYYEELPMIKKLSMFQDSDSEGSLSNELSKSLSDARKNVQRSESWSFYDTVHVVPRPKSEPYENVVIHDDCPTRFNTVSNIYSKSPSIAATGSSEQDTITPNSSVYTDARDSSSSDEYSVIASRPESIASSLSVVNELYDNWDPITQQQKKKEEENVVRPKDLKKRLFPSKSVILEFDPLYENVSYGSSKDDLVAKGDSGEEEVDNAEESPQYSVLDYGQDSEEESASLPVPPERVDSISSLSTPNVKNIPNDVEYYLYHRTKDKRSGSMQVLPSFADQADEMAQLQTGTPDSSQSVSPDRDDSPSPSPGKRKSNLVRWTSMKRAIKAVADGSNWSPGVIRRMSKSNTKLDQEPLKQDVLERPVPDPASSHIHGGFVFRSPSGGEKLKDFAQRWCQLGEGKLTFSIEKNGASTKDIISLDTICSIQVIRDVKSSGDGEDVHCMELTVSPRAKTHLIGSPGTTERRIWMQKLLESLTSVFPARITADYSRAGWCFLKEGISGEWMASWVLLNKRTLYYSQCSGRIKEIDLRKARCIGLQEGDKGTSCPRASEEGAHILVDAPDQAIYLQMDAAKETKSWRQTIRAAAVDNGPNLSDQQLSKNNIPAIVEKCINFVYAHGLMSEGIYRRCGANSNVTRLMTAFQTDAWSVQISRQDYSEYDVANVLKRFFRDLPEPVFTAQLHKHLCNTAGLKCREEEKLSMYRTQLEQLPVVNYLTIRLLLSHLYALHQQRERNLMPVENLAAIWAPTLMHVESRNSSGEMNWSKQEAEVIGELISLYPKLFMVDQEEIAREKRMQEVLERYHNSSTQQHPQMAAPAGDLRVWIHVGSKDSADCVQVTVGPLRQASDVCAALCGKMNLPAHKLCLVETVLDGALSRPLHHSEKVLDSVLRWGYWDDIDCKNNCLVLAENKLFEEVVPLVKQAIPKSGELKFADQKSKSFKSYVFEFSQANLSYYKDKAGAQKLGEWRIEDIVWYIGHEPKRNPHMRWAITFISKNNKLKRSKDSPFFGCTIAGPTREEQMKWVAAMLLGQYPHSELLPPPLHVDLLK